MDNNNVVPPSFKKTLRYLVIVLCYTLVLAFSFLDYVISSHPSLVLFYLIPIALVTWLSGALSGVVITLLSALTWIFNDLDAASSLYVIAGTEKWNIFAKLCLFLTLVYFITRLKNSYEREQVLARTDDLTGLANKRSFLEVTRREIYRARRYGHPLSILYLDLDDFKFINDLHGHSDGDRLLRAIAETIQKSIRLSDVAGRMGGDEFAVLLPETGDEGVYILSNRIKEDIVSVSKNMKKPLTVSIGVLTCAKPPHSLDDLLKTVDGLMYMAKLSGKNQIRHQSWEETIKKQDASKSNP